MRWGLEAVRVHSNQQNLVVNRFFFTSTWLVLHVNINGLEIRGRHETRGSDGVSVWILCVGTLVQLNGCSGVGFGLRVSSNCNLHRNIRSIVPTYQHRGSNQEILHFPVFRAYL